MHPKNVACAGLQLPQRAQRAKRGQILVQKTRAILGGLSGVEIGEHAIMLGGYQGIDELQCFHESDGHLWHSLPNTSTQEIHQAVLG